jgi:mRNA interferase RelE/StbE
MSYCLTFIKSSKKEWDKLNPSIQKQFLTKLVQRLSSPHVPKDKLSGLPNCYKIKLKAIGYRLVYQVFDDRLVVTVIAVGPRENNFVYKQAYTRI